MSDNHSCLLDILANGSSARVIKMQPKTNKVLSYSLPLHLLSIWSILDYPIITSIYMTCGKDMNRLLRIHVLLLSTHPM